MRSSFPSNIFYFYFFHSYASGCTCYVKQRNNNRGFATYLFFAVSKALKDILDIIIWWGQMINWKHKMYVSCWKIIKTYINSKKYIWNQIDEVQLHRLIVCSSSCIPDMDTWFVTLSLTNKHAHTNIRTYRAAIAAKNRKLRSMSIVALLLLLTLSHIF